MRASKAFHEHTGAGGAGQAGAITEGHSDRKGWT
jgi:hypothetical protein